MSNFLKLQKEVCLIRFLAMFRVLCLFLGIPMLVLVQVFAQAPLQIEKEVQASEKITLLAAVNAVLTNTQPQTGAFTQITPNGTRVSGTYQLMLPDRLRFAYDEAHDGVQNPVVTIAGPWIAVQDRPGAEANRFPVAVTPLQLLRKAGDQSLTPQHIIGQSEDADSVRVTLADPTGDIPGRLTLVLAKPGLELKGWVVVDVQALVTRVELHSIKQVNRLGAEVFYVYEDESDSDD